MLGGIAPCDAHTVLFRSTILVGQAVMLLGDAQLFAPPIRPVPKASLIVRIGVMGDGGGGLLHSAYLARQVQPHRAMSGAHTAFINNSAHLPRISGSFPKAVSYVRYCKGRLCLNTTVGSILQHAQRLMAALRLIAAGYGDAHVCAHAVVLHVAAVYTRGSPVEYRYFYNGRQLATSTHGNAPAQHTFSKLCCVAFPADAND